MYILGLESYFKRYKKGPDYWDPQRILEIIKK